MNFSASAVKVSVSISVASGSDGNRLAKKSGHVHFAKGLCAARGNAHQMTCHTLRRSAEALSQILCCLYSPLPIRMSGWGLIT